MDKDEQRSPSPGEQRTGSPDKQKTGTPEHHEAPDPGTDNEIKPPSQLREPLDRLVLLQERIKQQSESLKSSGVNQQLETGDLEALQGNVTEAKGIFEELKEYCNGYADASKSVGSAFGDVSKELAELVEIDASKNEDEARDEKTAEELEAESRAAEAQAQLAALAVAMHQLQELAIEAEESASRAAGAAARAVSQADRVEGRAEEAQRQAEAEKGKADKQKREEEAIRMEEERKVKKAEESKKHEEERLMKIEEQKKEEEHRKQEEERKKQEKEDPKHWPTHVFSSTNEQSDYLQHCISCIFRSRGTNFQRQDFECSTLEALSANFPIHDHEEIVGNIVHIKPTEGAQLDGAVWLALPFSGVKIGTTREVIIRQRDSKGAWHNLYARETTIPDHTDAKFVETPLRNLEEMSLVPVTRLKCDSVKVAGKGGKIVSTADTRVSIHVPKAAFPKQTDVHIQVQHMDHSSLHDLRTRHEVCLPLIGISPLLVWRFHNPPAKPLKILMPGPTGGNRKRPKTSVDTRRQGGMGSRPSTAWGGKPHRDDASTMNDKVYVLVKSASGNWHHRNDVRLLHTRDVLSMEIQDIGESLVLLRVQGDTALSSLPAMAEKVEASFDDRPVSAIIRQMSEDEVQVHAELCRGDRTEKRVAVLRERRYDCGANPSHEFFLNEGDLVEMRFRGNINFSDEATHKFVYYANLPTSRMVGMVKELDKFAQHGLEFYRGYLQIWVKKRKPPKVSKPGSKSKDVPRKGTNEFKMVAELPVTLPKPEAQLTTVSRAPVKFRSQGPLTMEYFNELTGYLGDEWRALGEELGISKARIQSIVSNNANGGDKLKFILEMLLTWFKGSSASNNKVGDLFWGLRNINREDLAQDLYRKNLEFQEESDRRYEDEKMRQAFKAVTDSTTALLRWKSIAQELGVPGADINDIDKPEDEPMREKATKALNVWREMNRAKATRKRLIKVLRKMNLVEAAENVSRLR